MNGMMLTTIIFEVHILFKRLYTRHDIYKARPVHARQNKAQSGKYVLMNNTPVNGFDKVISHILYGKFKVAPNLDTMIFSFTYI